MEVLDIFFWSREHILPPFCFVNALIIIASLELQEFFIYNILQECSDVYNANFVALWILEHLVELGYK